MAEGQGGSGDGGEKGKPAITSRATTGARAATAPRPSTDPKTGPVPSSGPKTGPVPSGAPKTGPAVTGRRPLVSKEAKEKAAAIAEAKPKPFYARIPKNVARVLIAIVVLAALVPVSFWAYRAFKRAQNPDEYAVREQLSTYRFDDDQAHFANLDAMGPKAVDIAIKLLVDRTPAEISGGKSTTTIGELAAMYLVHYAAKVKVDPPAKATEASNVGLPMLSAGQWNDLQQAWTTWFTDVKAKGLALK